MFFTGESILLTGENGIFAGENNQGQVFWTIICTLHENMFYRQINATTFFLAYFLTLEDIVETFRSQFTNIFKKNARGEGYIPPPVSHIVQFAHDV